MSWRRPTELCCPIFLEKLKNHTKKVPDKKDSSFFSYFQSEMISNLFNLVSLSLSLTQYVPSVWLYYYCLEGEKMKKEATSHPIDPKDKKK